MTEKETQKKTSQEASDETKNTANTQEELSIPKIRFDEVNNAKKELEKQLKTLQDAQKEREKKELEEKEQYKELADKLKVENEQLRLESYKQNLIQEAINSKELHPRLSHMIKGGTEEEIKKTLEEAKAYHKEVIERVTQEHTASDNTGTKKAYSKKEPMSQAEYMKLMKEDPEEAERYIKEITEQQ